MTDTPAIRFANRELAQRIAVLNGGKTHTVTVKMVGQQDVSNLLNKMKKARSVTPSSLFRVK